MLHQLAPMKDHLQKYILNGIPGLLCITKHSVRNTKQLFVQGSV